MSQDHPGDYPTHSDAIKKLDDIIHPEKSTIGHSKGDTQISRRHEATGFVAVKHSYFPKDSV